MAQLGVPSVRRREAGDGRQDAKLPSISAACSSSGWAHPSFFWLLSMLTQFGQLAIKRQVMKLMPQPPLDACLWPRPAAAAAAAGVVEQAKRSSLIGNLCFCGRVGYACSFPVKRKPRASCLSLCFSLSLSFFFCFTFPALHLFYVAPLSQHFGCHILLPKRLTCISWGALDQLSLALIIFLYYLSILHCAICFGQQLE